MSTNKQQHLKVAPIVARNESFWCAVKGCQGHRHKLSQYCLSHYQRTQRHGDPLAVPVRVLAWKSYTAKVEALLAANPDHPGITQAVRFVDGWMTYAAANPHEASWASEVALLKTHGVSALQVITQLAACWTYLQESPRACRSDSHRAFTLSKAVLSLAPRPRKYSPTANAVLNGGGKTYGYQVRSKASALAYIGPHLVTVMAALLVNISTSLRTDEEQQETLTRIYREPFNTVTAKAINKGKPVPQTRC